MGENWTERMQIDLIMIIALEVLKIVEVAGYIAVMSEEPYKTPHISLYGRNLRKPTISAYIAENINRY